MNISFINPEQMLYSQIQIQIHPSPFQWMLPLLCYVIQLLHHELREDQFASILQVGVLTLSGVPCPFSSRNSVIWNTVLETVQERASLIRKYFIKDLISPNHINEPCYMLYIWLPAVPHVTVIGQTTLVVPKEHSLRPVKMDFWNYTITRSWKSSCWSPNVEEDRLETRKDQSWVFVVGLITGLDAPGGPLLYSAHLSPLTQSYLHTYTQGECGLLSSLHVMPVHLLSTPSPCLWIQSWSQSTRLDGGGMTEDSQLCPGPKPWVVSCSWNMQ